MRHAVHADAAAREEGAAPASAQVGQPTRPQARFATGNWIEESERLLLFQKKKKKK
jgi:hypothetical protein